MNYAENIVLGVVSGVLTSALLLVLGTLYVRVLVPWLKAIRYQGVDVSGSYSADLMNAPDEPKSHVSLTLVQNAYELSGTFHLINRKPGNEFELTYEVRGRLWDSYLSISLVPVDRRITSVANALLRIGGGGVILEGVVAIRNTFTERVEANHLFMRRSKV